MEKLLTELTLINDVKFPYKSYFVLTEMIHKLSHQFGVSFSSNHTGTKRLTFVYSCAFGGITKNTVR